MSARSWFAVLAVGTALVSPAYASDVGYIHGRVITVDGDTYQGQLRWGAEESFWDDIFNGNKSENENLQFVDDDVIERRRRRHGWRGWDFGSDHDNGSFEHLFAIRFGDLKYINVGRGDKVVVGFRNGEEMKLDGGSNDIGASVLVVDPELGPNTIEWKRIRKIEFTRTPAKLASKLGEPLYGTVRSGEYDFTGRIQWDNDECLNIDKLDGETEDGKASVEFGDIESIKKYRNGSLVTLKSGREIYLSGTNDVNGDNRGVVVHVARIGSVRIGWKDFDEATFTKPPNTGRGYDDFAEGQELAGTVSAPGGPWEGAIVFDLDESWDFELLHGYVGETEYLVPFRNITAIRPHGTRRTDVELRNGVTLELTESQDVTSKNDGVLVFTGGRKPRYIAWGDITEIMLR